MRTKESDSENHPIKQGIYLARGVWDDDEPQEIDVYEYPTKELCCFSEDFGNSGTEVDDRHDCHVSVQFIGLEFISRIGDSK